MKPYTEDAHLRHMLAYGQVAIFEMMNICSGKIERFILEPEEIFIRELQDEQKLR